MNRQAVRRIARAILPLGARRWLWHRHLFVWPPVGRVRFGSLRRVAPVSAHWGLERGKPIDRHYIERFLAERASYIRGVALEFHDDMYLRRFGGSEITCRDVMNYEPGDPATTVVADLADASALPLGRYDAIVCTSVLHVIYDIRAAVTNLHAMLRPGGTVLVTTPGITRIARGPGWTDQWRLTHSSARKLFGGVFGDERVEVVAYGNALTSCAFLMGLAVRDLKPAELDAFHPDFELVVAVRATRAA